MQSLTDPYNEQTAQGYGALTQSLGQRGVMGSSFGDQALTNYNLDRSRGLADVMGKGQMNMADTQLKQQAVNNALYGRAFDVLGRSSALGSNGIGSDFTTFLNSIMGQ
jgi:hypothetical protein